VLHDDVLPQIHTAMILLQSIATVPPPLPTPIPHQAEPADAINSEVVAILADAHRQIADLLHDLPATSGSDLARLGVVAALRVMVAREQSESFDHITWDIDPATEQMAHQISALTAEVLFYATREAMRNAARHGRGGDPQRSLQLHIGALCREGELALIIEDDGVGFGAAGASPGSGRGLMLHSTMLAVVGGSLIAEHRAHGGTRIRLAVPIA
jgi:signal transduction histidine kinase